MESLLDRYIPHTTPFRPSNGRELFALLLSQKLDDSAAVRHYADLAETYSEGQLLCAYRRAIAAARGEINRRFHSELAQIHGNGHYDHLATLLAIRIERRSVAIAIFHGDQLEYTDSRQLSSAKEKAEVSATGFILWALARFPVESVALEAVESNSEIQRRALRDAIHNLLRDRMLPVWEIPRTVLLKAYGHPPVKSRPEMRQIATTIWPILAGSNAKVFIQDAAVLGLYVQTERLFMIN